jgi:hypothetical protein
VLVVIRLSLCSLIDGSGPVLLVIGSFVNCVCGMLNIQRVRFYMVLLCTVKRLYEIKTCQLM